MLVLNLPLDRKSGSAGMPRPISYAVFCLKKKIRFAEMPAVAFQDFGKGRCSLDRAGDSMTDLTAAEINRAGVTVVCFEAQNAIAQSEAFQLDEIDQMKVGGPAGRLGGVRQFSLPEKRLHS